MGQPCEPDWDTAVRDEANEALIKTREDGLANGTFSAEDIGHRRGDFYTLVDGVSYGGGQTVSNSHPLSINL